MASWRARQTSGTVVALALLIAACTASAEDPEPEPARPVTVTESRLLADVRARNVDAGSRAITATFTDRGRELRLDGWFDYSTGTGYGTVSSDGLPSDRVTWNGELVATAAGKTMGKPLTSLDGWTAAPLDPSGSALGVVLAVLAGLGAERPDDAALIRRGGALWLREDETGGRSVTVFAGPTSGLGDGGGTRDDGGGGRGDGSDRDRADETDAGGEAPASGGPDHEDAQPVDPDASRIRYWVDDDGLAHRVDVRLGDTWAEVILENDDVPVPPLLADIDLDVKGGVARTDAAPKDGD